MLIAILIPRRRPISLNAAAANCGPRSDIILSGRPNLLYTFRINMSAAPIALIVLLQGVNITPLVRPWSTMTMIESCPLSVTGKSIISPLLIVQMDIVYVRQLVSVVVLLDVY